MSTLLRTCKYISVISRKHNILRNLKYVRSSCHLPAVHRDHFVLPSTHSHIRPYVLNAAELYPTNPENQHNTRYTSSTQLDKFLSKLDSDARRFGRINQDDVKTVLSLVKQTRSISGTQSLLLIRACGSVLPEMPKAERRQLAQDVWKTLLELNCSLDVSHYNALLKVYVENEHDFDPIQFLGDLERNNIHPNRVTYQRLVSHYCQNGDMDGAGKILEFMKSKDLPMNELIFNDLIMGNVRGNNLEDGKNIIGVMRNANMPINSSTYASLACGYATLGDITNVLATIHEASSEKAPLTDRDLLNIIYTLAVSKHEYLVEQVLPEIQHKPGYSQDCLIVILELINKGYHELGFTLLNTMPQSTSADGSAAPSGAFFIRQLVKQDVPPDVVIDYCRKLKDTGLNDSALLKATERALRFHKPDAAISFIKELHSQGYDIGPHFFWPVLACKRGNEGDFYKIIKLMVDMKCPADGETFLIHFFPYVPIDDPHSVIDRLKVIGYEEKDVVQPLILFLLQNGDTRITAGLLKNCSVEMLPLVTLSQAYIKSQDQFSTVQILQHLDSYFQAHSVENRSTNIYGEFLHHLVVSKSFSMPLLEKYLLTLEDKELKLNITNVTFDIISSKLDASSKAKISNLIRKLSSALSDSAPDKLVQDDPEIKMKGFATTSKQSLSRMLLFHARQKNLNRVQEILKELNKQDFEYSGPTYAALIELYNFHNDLDNALYYKGLLDKEFPVYPIKEHTIINLATTLVQHKRFGDAGNLIATHHSKHGCQEEPRSLLNNVLRLLQSLASSDEPERTRTFFESLLDFGYCKPEKLLLVNLVQAHLKKNNTNDAADEFVRIAKTYKCTPSSFDLLNHLILQEDTQNLQKVTDAAISVHGEANVLLDLAMSFIECGRLEQARKLIETPGLRVKNERFEYICNFFISREKIKDFESFLQITKNIFGLNRDRMYYHLLRAYASHENVEQALNVWIKMQEEDIQPSDQTLHFLGTFLQKMNRPVPFVIPDLPAEAIIKSKQNLSMKEKLEEANLEMLLTDEQRAKLHANSLNVTDISKTIKALLEVGKLKEALKLSQNLLSSGLYPNSDAARFLAMKLGDAGDKDSLLQLQDKLPERVARSIPFKDYIANAFLNSGQTDEFLESLENEVFKYKNNFPGGGLLAILSAHPGTLDRVKKLVDVYYQEGTFIPRNMLWIYLMNNHKFEEAEKVFETTPEMKSHLYFEKVISAARKKNDVEVSQRLLDQAKKSTLTNSTKGLIYSTHIIVLIAIQKVDEALTTLKELQTLMNLDDLSNATRMRLTQCLKEAGVSVPFALPQSLDDTSSSSSDDDK